jgi:hypothetical protein
MSVTKYGYDSRMLGALGTAAREEGYQPKRRPLVVGPNFIWLPSDE